MLLGDLWPRLRAEDGEAWEALFGPTGGAGSGVGIQVGQDPQAAMRNVRACGREWEFVVPQQSRAWRAALTGLPDSSAFVSVGRGVLKRIHGV
jgi:hypothetical protein